MKRARLCDWILPVWDNVLFKDLRIYKKLGRQARDVITIINFMRRETNQLTRGPKRVQDRARLATSVSLGTIQYIEKKMKSTEESRARKLFNSS